MFKKIVNKMIVVVMVLCLGMVFTGCGKSDISQYEKIKESGKIVVGTSADYPPYEFHTEINGKDEIVGFDIEIAKEIAKDMGVELEIKDMDFGGLLAALNTGTVDFVVAGMTPTDERKEKVDFTNIYYNATQAVVVKVENKDKIKSMDDLKGKKIGVQMGSIQEGIAKDQVEEAEVKSLGKVSDLMLELKNDKVDALIVELPVAKAYVNKNSDLGLTNVTVKDETGGSAIAIKKGSKELTDQMNKTLDKLVKENKIEEFVVKATDMID
ncbi:ABC transporter substrate-binding protein [Tepidibacter hydrothermalis]|uniref:ABC transporter substrate-binding protein n=1 Tax=Tepidibacter hydrothermalis TaxID=3036126 RepID=A0ABY8EFA2_9FIRM|nr:ABC transporter substrate-binding protein [Tepidibacter hydrothermalis]WFD11634.1 ABC transporter substrate-binding protein [Tepidibacter hydrothermalis]